MRPNAAADKWRTPLARSAVFRAAGLSIFGLIVWLGLFSADGPALRVVWLVAVQALAALAGVAWYLPRARSERRWRAALDHCGEQELAKQGAGGPEDVPPPALPLSGEGAAAHRRGRRDLHAGPGKLPPTRGAAHDGRASHGRLPAAGGISEVTLLFA